MKKEVKINDLLIMVWNENEGMKNMINCSI